MNNFKTPPVPVKTPANRLRKAPFVFVLWMFTLPLVGQPPKLEVSANKRFLVTDDGKPFFWLGDTAWELFHRLSKDEIDHYLRNRSGKGFTVVQAVILSEINGLTVPNRENQLPLVDLDPTRWNEKYFELVDFAVEKAAEFNMYMALLPTWGAHAEDRPGFFENHHIFTDANAREYGRMLGRRYRNHRNIVWILGGDRPADRAMSIWEAMAQGLTETTNGQHLISYHPMGQQSSSFWMHEKSWLDFNIVQTGHLQFSFNVYDWIDDDYRKVPTKPILNGEPAYEDMPQWFNASNPRYDDYHVRKIAYWCVFAGAFGHTYGNNNIWQMYRPEYTPVIHARIPWNEALEHPGAGQLRYLRNLMESRPYLSRIPDQSLYLSKDEKIPNPSFSSDHVRITRDGSPGKNDATYIMAYLPLNRSVEINTRVIAGDELFVWWYSPKTGEAYPQGSMKNEGKFAHSNWSGFIKPNQPGPDWVIVIDDASKRYPPPGRR